MSKFKHRCHRVQRSGPFQIKDLTTLRPLRLFQGTGKTTATSEMQDSVSPLWSAFWGARPSLFLSRDCHPRPHFRVFLFACASLFIANRALNLTSQMDIALCVSACAREAINNVSYENLIISVFSPLAISLYLCPLSSWI